MTNEADKKSFEELLDEVERAVEQLSQGSLPLDQALAMYERGFNNLRLAQLRLAQAREKLELLRKDEPGESKEA